MDATVPTSELLRRALGARAASRLRRTNLRDLGAASVSELTETYGLTPKSAEKAAAVLELAKTYNEVPLVRGGAFMGSADIFRHFGPRMRDLKVEQFWALLLDGRHRLIKEQMISQGTLTSSPVHPREVFSPAIRHSAAAIVVCHGPPSGDPSPSADDLEITRRLVQVGDMVGIRYGAKEHDAVLDGLSDLYLYWRRGLKLDGEIVSVEQEILVTLPGIDLPLRGYADLVLRRPDGTDAVWDFKTSAARPPVDPLMDRLDLQLLAMVCGWEAKSGRTVTSWRWEYLTKTKAPAVVDVDVALAPDERGAGLSRLAATVNPTLRVMEAVLAGKLDPVPTQAPFRMCGTCPYRERTCSRAFRDPRSVPATARAS